MTIFYIKYNFISKLKVIKFIKYFLIDIFYLSNKLVLTDTKYQKDKKIYIILYF